MKPLRELADRWESEADLLERYGDQPGAQVARLHALELRQAIDTSQTEVLTLAEAALASGYSKRRLREMVAEGTLPNAGRKNAPRLRRGDLPKKPARDTGFDAGTLARQLAG